MSNEYLEWLNDLRDAPEGTIDHNRWLCLKFPWLVPRNRWTDEEIKDFDYSWTELDAMPDGWRKAFGEQMCEEIQKLLEEADWVYKYRILQIKEKWGCLHWYDSTVPESIRERLNAIIQKYEDLSKKTCINCGAPAKWKSLGCIAPWCDKCVVNIDETIKEI